MQTETITLSASRKVTLTAYLQEVDGPFDYVKRRPAVLILPGGGYQYCSKREMDPVAYGFLQAGFQTFILNYSVRKEATWPTPLNDYDQAMDVIRQNAGAWNLYPDKIAVIGFSAGGHLAAAAATMSRQRPNAAILGYAAAGEDVKVCLPSAPDTIDYVDERTCPCFLFATRNDKVVPIQNSLRFMDALAQADVSFESHIYAYGPHGFSTADSSVQNPAEPICDRVPNWQKDAIGWLRDVFGDFSEDGLTKPKVGHYATADREPTLSLDCTVGHVLQNPIAQKKLLPLLRTSMAQKMLEPLQENVGLTPNTEGADRLKDCKMVLRGVLGFIRCPEPIMELLDRKLKKIPNV